MRIVSLIASSTEMVCALGLRDQLVGRSHECDFPPDVRALPQCTEIKFNPDGTSYEIDQRVKAILQEGLSVYRVSAEKLRALRPDVILTQTQCEVCAVSLKDVEAAVCELIDSKPRIISLHPNALADVWTDLRRVADALAVPERGEKLIAALQSRIETIAHRAKTIEHPPPPALSPMGEGSRCSAKGRGAHLWPRVAYIEWIDPLMAGGNWMPELIALAGGENLFGAAGKHSPWMTWGQLCAANPDVIVVSPCGFDIARTQQEMHLLTERAEWKNIAAVQDGHVVIADGNQFFNRPGPRLVESLEILAEIFHPNVFSFGHEGNGWITAE